MLLSKALAVGEELVAALRDHPAAIRVELAGQRAAPGRHREGPRHRRPPSSDPAALAEAFAGLDGDRRRVRRSARPARKVVTHSGLPVDLRIVPEEAFGNLLQHFTGSGQAQRGAADRGGQARPARERVRHLGRRVAANRRRSPPRRRSTSGSACSTSRRSCARTAASSQAAREGRLPELIELGDIRGDLHMHTTLSDGHASVEEMASAARELRLRVHRDHRPLRLARLRQRRAAGRAAAARSRRSARCPTSASRSSPAPRRTCCPTARSTTRTTCSSSSTGSSPACTRRSGCPRRSRRSGCCRRWSTRSSTRSGTPPAA